MELLKKALEANTCPFCGFGIYGKAGKVVCEYDDCLFILEQSDVTELLGHNPFSFEIKPVSCREYIGETKMTGDEPVMMDTHEWVEVENTTEKQVLRCEKCGKESVATHPTPHTEEKE